MTGTTDTRATAGSGRRRPPEQTGTGGPIGRGPAPSDHTVDGRTAPAPRPGGSRTPTGAVVLDRERRRARRRRRVRRSLVLLARLAVVAGIVLGWDAASGTLVRPFFVSTPKAVGRQLATWFGSGDFWFHARFTLTSAGLGFLVGTVAAVLLAWPLALRRAAYRIVEPYFLAAYSVPAVALGPVFILWFGIGQLPKVLLAAYFVFFIVFVNVVEGIRQVPRGLLDVTRVMGGSSGQTMRLVLFPSALPYLLAALRVGLPAAMIGAVVGEFIASNRGIGYLTRAAAGHYQTAGVIAGTIVLTGLVLLMSTMLAPLSRALRWQSDVRIRGGEGT